MLQLNHQQYVTNIAINYLEIFILYIVIIIITYWGKKMKIKLFGIFVITLLITIATSPIVSAVPILDQRQEKCDGEKFIPNLAWQEFIPTMKLLREVEVKVTHWYGGSPNLKLSIEQPLGTVLTFKELPVSDIPSGTSGWVNFDVPDYTLTPGQKYYITLTYPPGGEYGWCAGNGDPYVSGESSGPADEDFCFRTWANKGKSKNSINIEGEWSNPLFQWFLENHPHLFPLLRQLLRL